MSQNNCYACLKTLADKPSRNGYHDACLKRIFGTISVDPTIRISQSDFITKVREKTSKHSISGVQPKASVAMNQGALMPVNSGGEYILKPSPDGYELAAENEHLCMLIARHLGFVIPEVCLVPFAVTDRATQLGYLIKRYDRDNGHKYEQEDLLQAMGFSNFDSNNKYNSASYEDVLKFIGDRLSTADAFKALKLIILSYYLGNDDLHLKNMSLVKKERLEVSPLYDVLSSSLYSGAGRSVIALDMFNEEDAAPYYSTMGNGMYAGADFIKLSTISGIPKKPTVKFIHEIQKEHPKVLEIIAASYLSAVMKNKLQQLLEHRLNLLKILEVQ